MLTLLVLAVPGFAWENRIKVADDVTAKAIYLDPSTGLTHVVWCQQLAGPKDLYMFYKRVAPDGTQSKVVKMEATYGCNEVSLDGQGDGKQLFIAYSGARVSGDFECSPSFLYGCLDVYTKQSDDGGNSWNPSVAVPRTEFNDFSNRTSPRVMQVRETVRTIVVFSKCNGTHTRMFYVTRPENSIIYGLETQLGSTERLFPSLAYTVDPVNPKNQVLHLAWCERFGQKTYLSFYSQSKTWGVIWSTPAAIARHDSGVPAVRLATSSTAPGIVFRIFPDTPYGKWVVRMSKDQGFSWTANINTLPYYGYISGALCGVKVKGLEPVLFLLSLANSTGAYGTYSVTKGLFEKERAPFGNVGSKTVPDLVCMSVPASKSMVAKAAIMGGDNGRTLYYSSHDHTPYL